MLGLFLSATELYSLGYIGILGLSLVASLVIFIPVPYLAVIVLASLSGKFDLTLLAISSAVGATLGKLVIFQACYSGQRLVNQKARTNLESFEQIFERYAWFAIFVAASTPIPDDVVYVPLGFARYNRLKFFLSTLLGKVVLSLVVVFGARFLSSELLGLLVGGSQQGDALTIIVAVIFAVFTLLLTIYIARIDWSKFSQRYLQRNNQK